MNPLESLQNDVARARSTGVNFGDEWRRVDDVLGAFASQYECVTVRSLGGSLEIGRPNNVPGGHDFWVSVQGAEAVPALMLKRKPHPNLETAPALRAARALLSACERGDTTGNEMDTLREALSQLED